MPAKIRLYQQGVRNHPFWWIVVQGGHKNPKGRFIERLGYWLPRETKKHVDRSIILNQPRLRYWIGVGAEPTPGVLKVLETAELIPKRPPKHGSDTLYEKPVDLDPNPAQDWSKYGFFAYKGAELEAQYLKNKDRLENGFNIAAKDAYVANPEHMLKHDQQHFHEMIKKVGNVMENFQGKLNTPAKRWIFWKQITELEKEMTPQHFAKEAGCTIEEAEQIIEDYNSSHTFMTDQDIVDHSADLTKGKLHEKLKEGPVIVPANPPITPLPDLTDNRANDQPYNLYEPVTPLNTRYVTQEAPKMKWKKFQKKKPGRAMHATGFRFK